MGKKILEGIRVCDLTNFLSGPFSTMILADLGAEVIKLERSTGDVQRFKKPIIQGTTPTYCSINRGKKSFMLEIDTSERVELAKKIAAKSDIFVENFRGGNAATLGVGYEDIKKVKPDIIYISISGFGQTGPYKERGALDGVVQAMSGLISITGKEGTEGSKVGVSIADLSAGLYAAMAAILGLYHRERTGEGMYVDLAMLDALVSLLENPIVNYLNAGIEMKPMGNRHPAVGLFDSVRTKDGSVLVTCPVDHQFEKFASVLGLPDLIKDERFKTISLRRENEDALLEIIEPETMKLTTKELMELLLKNGLPAGEINKISDVVKDPQLIERNMFITVHDNKAGDFKVPGSPFMIANVEPLTSTFAAQKGEHTVDVLKNLLGMNDKEVEETLKIIG
jgi:CoA:oxalate CoA-transferase